jgi:hypothetical protein
MVLRATPDIPTRAAAKGAVDAALSGKAAAPQEKKAKTDEKGGKKGGDDAAAANNQIYVLPKGTKVGIALTELGRKPSDERNKLPADKTVEQEYNDRVNEVRITPRALWSLSCAVALRCDAALYPSLLS